MHLLPDIFVSGHTLSLQDPYTIDGELIRQISVGSSFENYMPPFYITTNTHGYIVYLNDFCGEMNRVARETRLDRFVIEDDWGTHINTVTTPAKYYDAVKEQCHDIFHGNGIGRMYGRLHAQNRGPVGSVQNNESITVRDAHDRLIYSSTVSPNVLRREDIAHFDAETMATRSFFNTDLLARPFASDSSSDSSVETKKKYIHAWNYKPEYIHHKLDTEDSPLLLGVEIEVDGNEDEKLSRDEVVKNCIAIINGNDSEKEDLIYSTSDSSVQIELDTMPCSLEFHKQKMNYKEMLGYLDSLGYKGHDGQHAGLHIHADRSFLGDSPLLQQLVIAKILYILEKFNDEICMIARRDCRYSNFVGNGKDEDSLVELYGKYKTKGKNVALNLQHKDTIEFRCFKSTLKPETLLLTLEFVQDIIYLAKSFYINEIEWIKWSDLMKMFSDELREYYLDRCKKAEEKKENESCSVKKIQSTSSSDTNECIGAIDGSLWQRFRDALHN